ncbi:hypothetical protein BS50DRAFT_64793 [Corynespora cassiicola Philippines]|uniref:Uncharacterized protein n=1 Tax=Corynespora cassiicola Philippines TaxID=1448308 RepID=A0A2T2MZK2_CORCC|nr:hypothetical protein BS50DRAFT_64793 [Corynespora cassiicola Philippines]
MQLVVAGDQSSGKSSVLEGLTSLPFPRDSTLCTRFATQIVFRRAEVERVSISIIPSGSYDDETSRKLRSFKQSSLQSFSASEFERILSKACDAMDIPSLNEPRKLGQSTFSEHIFRVELLGPTHNHLSVIDVPGIFRTPTEGLTTSEDIDLVKRMVQRFIQNERTIILAVIPANVDIATQEILNMAKNVDPQGQRTLGVLTKPDLVDRGAERDILDLVQSKKHRLRLGYCLIRNRGQQERNIPTSERHQKEYSFFRSGPFSMIAKDRVGIPALHERLRSLLQDITQREYPHVKREIYHRIATCENELRILGPSRESDHQQRIYLVDMAVRFQSATSYALNTHYGMDNCFNDESMRLATQIVAMNDQFSEAVRKNGCTVDFDGSSAQPLDLGLPQKPKSLNKHRASKSKHPGLPIQVHESSSWFPDVSCQEAPDSVDISEYPELDDILHHHQRQESQITEDILSWIERIYKSSRGFELGTFDPAISPFLFNQQTINWEHLAMDYINDVILHIHRFCHRLLSHVCTEERVRNNLWTVLVREILPIYQKTIKQIHFILQTEREGNLITTNHYFSENLEKARAERLKKAADELSQIVAAFAFNTPENATTTDHLERVSGISNLKHTVQDIHDILKAYYTVARKRFVDNVCMQATDYHLVSGPETPLKVFSPSLISNLTSNQLETIAGEDMNSIQRRKELYKEIESLRDGINVLAAC